MPEPGKNAIVVVDNHHHPPPVDCIEASELEHGCPSLANSSISAEAAEANDAVVATLPVRSVGWGAGLSEWRLGLIAATASQYQLDLSHTPESGLRAWRRA
jgi:hypothetical protein